MNTCRLKKTKMTTIITFFIYQPGPALYIACIPSGIITAKAVPTSRPAPNTVTSFNFSYKRT